MKTIISAFLLFLTAAAIALARLAQGLFDGWYHSFSQSVSYALGYATAFVPFSLFELALVVLPVAMIVYIVLIVKRVRYIKMPGMRFTRVKRIASTLLLWASALLFSFFALWALRYFLPSPLDKLGIERDKYSVSELYDAAVAARDLAAAIEVPRDDALVCDFGSFGKIADITESGYTALSKTYDGVFTAHAPKPKAVIGSTVMSYMGISGIYSVWSGECNVNAATPDAALPFTAAHEQAHRQGIAREDEANFVAFLACRAATAPEARYSAYYSAFIYLSNELLKEDGELWGKLWSGLSDGMAADLGYSREYYEKYDGVVSDISSSINDGYLQTMNQEAGIRSYGLVADLLISLHKSGGL